MKILWLTPPNSYSEKLRKKLELYLKQANISLSHVMYHNVHKKLPSLWYKKTDKSKSESLDLSKKPEFENELDNAIRLLRPTIIVCNDVASLGFLADGLTSLDLGRGSVYNYKSVPVLVVDDLLKTVTTNEGGWLLLNDLQKVRRWQTGKQRREPKFVFTVVNDMTDAERMFDELHRAEIVAEDIETGRGFITCITFTALQTSGEMHTWVLPFFNNFKNYNAHWETPEEEESIWLMLRSFHANSKVRKVFQNGNYDCAYFMAYHCPPTNFTFDTMVMFHSIWCEAEKSLNKISAFCLDYCRYWKEDLKASKEDTKASKGSGLWFKTADKLMQYWRYAALDTYNTLLDCIFLAKVMASPKLAWARTNYAISIGLQIGPALRMSMTGMRVNKKRQEMLGAKLLTEHENALRDLRIMADDPNFNPASPDQFATMVYDVLRATPLKGRGRKVISSRSVDEKVLKIIIEQHPLIAHFVETVWECKKPLNNHTKYVGGLKLHNDRFMYALNAAGTETTRFSSQNHAFYCGTQIQNVPNSIRYICEADPGYVFLEFDYAQSDAWFVAFESEDPKFMQTMQSDKDTHCIHAAHFFKVDYDLVYTKYKADDDWAVHPLKGVRQITKRVVHGANFQMSDYTLYMTMGRQAVIGAAEALSATLLEGSIKGIKFVFIRIPGISEYPKDFVQTKPVVDPVKWAQDTLVKFCGLLLEDYHKLYTNLRKWFEKSKNECVRNGNLATNAFGRTRLFFGDVASDNEIQRQLSAYYGQSGTAGNINRTLMELYYDPEERASKLDLWFISQTHDSLLFMVPINKIDAAVNLVKGVMQKSFTIKGRTLAVPADGKFGKSWGSGLIKLKKDIDYVELVEKTELALDAKLAKEVYDNAKR